MGAAPAAVPAATMSRSDPRREGDMLPRGSDERFSTALFPILYA